MRQPEGRLKDEARDYLNALPGTTVWPIEVGYIPGRRNNSRGMFDRVVCQYGRIVFLEFKMPGEKLSSDQAIFYDDWTRHGGEAYIVHSMAEVRSIFPPPEEQLSLNIPE